MSSDFARFLNMLVDMGQGAQNLDQKINLAEKLRENSPELGKQVYLTLFRRIEELYRALQEANVNLGKCQEILEQLSAPPWFVADFIKLITDGIPEGRKGPRAMVACNGRRSLVTIDPERVNIDELVSGDEVLLSSQTNVVMARSSIGPSRTGETAIFSRWTDDGRMVLRYRDEEVVVEPAHTLRDRKLKEGDLIRWTKESWMAHEKLDPAACEGRRFLLEDVPPVSPDCVGGQDRNLQTLIATLTITLVDPDKADRYGLTGKRSVLVIGPSGTGKTLMGRVAASEVSRISGKKCKFAVVKPAEFEDPYVGVTERNIRSCFQALRQAASEGFAILFLDELESIGRIRGGTANYHADRFLGAWLAELDGFVSRGNVAIIAATNRKDLVDPALLERLSETEIVVNRPDMKGAKSIFHIHLPATLPFNPNHSSAETTRKEIINAAVSLLYAPNAGNELCVLRFRDNTTRTVFARELVSGRLIEQICREVRQTAFLRDINCKESGLMIQDMQNAIQNAIQKLSTTLTPRNVHTYLTDLSHDIDVVDVRPIQRKVHHPHRFLTPIHS